MAFGLTRPFELPEAVRLELEQLVASIASGFAVEHDADGRQRVVCGKWFAGAAQSLTDSVLTRIVVTRPDSRNGAESLTVDAEGHVRIGTRGVYLLVGQVTFASSALGRRAVQLRLNGADIAEQALPSGGGCTVQVVECVPCQPGDVVSLFGLQETGGALSTVVSGNDTWLRIARVG